MTHNVWIRLDDVCVSVRVNAATLEEALEKSKKISMREQILAKGVEWIDGEYKVTGVHENE